MSTKREPLMTQEYFDREVAYDAETIARFDKKLAESTAPPKNRAKLAYTIFRKRCESLLMRYSHGDAIAEIKLDFPALIASMERYQQMEGHQDLTIDKSFDDYVTSLWLVSWAIIFKIDADMFTRLLTCLGNAGKDAILEKMIATRVQGRPATNRLAWPKVYQRLFDAMEASPENRAGLFQTFLKGWYPSMKDVYWYDNHKGPDGGGFFGYWCIEAAGVVSAFGYDDRAFRDLPYYPRDLVGA